jgi:hypothetical protein
VGRTTSSPNIVKCPDCGAAVISEEIDEHSCRDVMLEEDALWLRKEGVWKKFALPHGIVERATAKTRAEGFDLPPSPTEVEQRARTTKNETVCTEDTECLSPSSR